MQAQAVDATLVGVNQRDLVTFEVDHDRALRMAGLMPAGGVRVAESGVRGPDDAGRLHRAGYHAVLVGETQVWPQMLLALFASRALGESGRLSFADSWKHPLASRAAPPL